MSIAVKICGINSAAAADAVARAGADFGGLVFFAKSPRALSIEDGAQLAARLRGRLKLTALVVDADDAVTRIHLYDAETFAPVGELPLPDIGAGFGMPLVPRPRFSPDGTSALLTFTSTAQPLTPLRIDTDGSGRAQRLLPDDGVVPPELAVTP